MAEVILEDVSRVFPNRVVAVNHVSLEVRDREFVVLVGPSGCGKTTTLRMIAGLEEISSGTIRIGGRPVNGVAPKDRNIAMVFQNYALYPHMSVYRNMAFGLELRHGANRLKRLAWRLAWPRKAAEAAAKRHWIASRVHEVAQTLGIEHLLERLPRELSGGERQRVAVGRAIVREPAAFLFDEPLSNLDAKMRVDMRRELRQLHQRLASTMIYVTHDQVEAMTLGQRIVVMHRGEVQQVGPPMEVYKQPTNLFVAGFIGTPAMNLVPGVLDGDGQQLAFRRGGWKLPLPANRVKAMAEKGSDVVLGIRPENVTVHRDRLPEATRAVVALVEPLGDATVVNLELRASDTAGPLTIASKAPAGIGVEEGDEVSVTFDSDEVHLFDAKAGNSLTSL